MCLILLAHHLVRRMHLRVISRVLTSTPLAPISTTRPTHLRRVRMDSSTPRPRKLPSSAKWILYVEIFFHQISSDHANQTKADLLLYISHCMYKNYNDIKYCNFLGKILLQYNWSRFEWIFWSLVVEQTNIFSVDVPNAPRFCQTR